MATREKVEELIRELVAKMNEIGPDVAADWGGAVQIIFSDLGTGWLLKMAMDGTVESCDEKIDEKAAEGTLEIDTDTYIEIWEKRLNPFEALSAGKVNARGSLDALIKLLPAIA